MIQAICFVFMVLVSCLSFPVDLSLPEFLDVFFEKRCMGYRCDNQLLMHMAFMRYRLSCRDSLNKKIEEYVLIESVKALSSAQRIECVQRVLWFVNLLSLKKRNKLCAKNS